jgi:multidrug transporter EmrE-like cation transporter
MVTKKNFDFIDKWIQTIQWKVGNFSMLPIFFGTLMALLDIMMMGSVKMISKGTMPSSWGIPLTVGIYALEPLIFLKALNYEGMVVTNLVWNLMSDIIVTLQGVFIFGESIKGLRWVAVCMSILSLGLMAYTDSE